MASVARDTSEAEERGILSFITDRSERLRSVCIQPTTPLGPDSHPNLTSAPPRPSPGAQLEFLTFHEGCRIDPPPGFVPNGCPDTRRLDPGVALAVEYIHQKDFNLGLSVVFPLPTARRLFKEAGLPLNGTPTHLVDGGPEKPEGRLTVNATLSGLNHPDKKLSLSARYDPIVYPSHMEWCRLFVEVRALFPGVPLAMFKADFDRWFKRFRLLPEQVGLLAMVFHIDGAPYCVIPLVGQFGCQEFNYVATLASAFIYARVRERDIALYGAPVRLCLSDDTAGFLPEDRYAADDAAFTALAVQIAGENAVPQKKKSCARIQATCGARYDLTDMTCATIGLTEVMFLKLVCLLFLELPRALVAGVTRVTVKQLQRTASYFQLTSSFLPPVLPFTHALYENLHKVPPSALTVVLTTRSVLDIAFWRAFLHGATQSTDWLSIPIDTLVLTSPPKSSDPLAYAHYQASRANYVIGADAATFELSAPTWGAGWTVRRQLPAPPGECEDGFYMGTTALTAWGMYELPTFSAYLRSGALSPDQLSSGDQINLYEMIAVLLAVDALLLSLPPSRCDHVHVHVWCDNSSAVAWLTRYKSHHPLVNFVLQVSSYLQCQYRCTLTLGHIPGRLNRVPDAISRRFRVEGGSQIEASLSHLTPHLSLPPWWTSLLTCSAAQSRTAWQVAADARTALARVR